MYFIYFFKKNFKKPRKTELYYNKKTGKLNFTIKISLLVKNNFIKKLKNSDNALKH